MSAQPPRIPFSFAKRHGLVVSSDQQGQPVVLYTRPPSALAIAEVQRVTGPRAAFTQVGEDVFDQELSRVYQNDSSAAMEMVEGLGDEMDLASLADSVPETEDLLEQEDDAPIIRLINALLTEAIKESASDIHIETFERNLIVRFRIDGVLREIVRPKRALAPLLISRIKVMARLDIAEKRIPQDGRISLRIGGKEVDVRVSTMPSINGERIVLRLLDKQAGRLELSQLGMSESDSRRMEGIIFKPHGIILVTGPTGSGKTTTLYATLTRLNDKSRNILTVEDPIEYNLEGIGQTQVNAKIDMTFARGLRAILRQDPDVVMVGEIRDLETAEIAIQASLTGHLVLSTLHTNSAVGAITRLIDMGIEPFLLSSSLLGVLAQRLVRVLCPHCKVPYTATEEECTILQANLEAPPVIYRAAGCKECNELGYRGRRGVYELITFNDELRSMIHRKASEHELETYARHYSTGIRSDGARQILQGNTTLEEVLRVTLEE
ncbi:general secretion pathway protein E [Desulfurispira natronophila]|uniref:protein-secreting ATPase n=2 Tax=Desulfurispira natronophila TaxID=682562 RepID=A0A7W7Y358_9BACT|nr:general secretion pathway protein E [Desulfurispira natronophila]